MPKIEKVERNYGWIPDEKDARDWSLEKLRGAVIPPEIALPPKIDLRPFCSKVEDQGNLGSCTANALAGALQFLENKDKIPYQDLSRLFIYYNERALEGTVDSDSGAQIRDGIKTLAKQGVCPESEWPYKIGQFKNKPTGKCYSDALAHKIIAYAKITTLYHMKWVLAQGFPFVNGFMVYQAFENYESGILPLPKESETPLGGHAILTVGYDDAQKIFIVKNSWGPDWGIKGYFYVPQAYWTNPDLASDFWYITRGGAL